MNQEGLDKKLLRKAAILVTCLDRSSADTLLDQMPDEQAMRIRSATVELGEIPQEEQAKVIEEFMRVGPLVPTQQITGIELDDSLAEKLTENRGSTTESDSAPPTEPPPFRFLHETAGETLAPYLARERPQTIAVVLSHLPPARAAEVLMQLDASLQVDVVRRLVDLSEADTEVVREVERGLESLLCDNVQSIRRRSAGLVAAQAILGAADGDAREAVLTNVARSDRGLADRLVRDQLVGATSHKPISRRNTETSRQVRRAESDTIATRVLNTATQTKKTFKTYSTPSTIGSGDGHPSAVAPNLSDARGADTEAVDFDFSHLTDLDEQSLRSVFASIDPLVARLALVGADRNLIEKVVRLFPDDQARLLSRQMEQIGPVQLRDVEQAQREIAHLVNRLLADGSIRPPARQRFAAAA